MRWRVPACVMCLACNRGPAEEDRRDGGAQPDARPRAADGGPSVDGEAPTPACADGEDNDRDDLLDFPDDPGCEDEQDDDEADPPPESACADGDDNDFDGHVDLDDPGCKAPVDDDERNTLVGDCGEDVPFTELVVGATASGTHPMDEGRFTGSCGGFGHETIYRIEIPTAGAYVASTVDDATALDTVVYLRTDCTDGDSEPPRPEGGTACNDQGTDPPASTVTALLDEGPVYVFVDSWSPSTTGAFRLHFDLLGVEGEPCDPEAPDTCAPGLVCREPEPDADAACLPPVCRDGEDNDDDERTDYPFDPGCIDADDGDEADPDPAPECGDGEDNDDDGETDYPDDTACEAASDGSEQDFCTPGGDELRALPPDGTDSGSTFGAGNHYTSACVSSDGPEVVYSTRLPGRASSVTVSLCGSSYDTALYLRRDDCAAGAQIGCNDDFCGVQSQVTVSNVEPGRLFFFIDGWAGDAGPYSLTVTGTLADGQPCNPSMAWLGCGETHTCRESAPGARDWACRPAACGNDADDDDDDLADYPDDPGCESLRDDDETDPDDPPVCWDRTDNDGDGFTDFGDDPGCLAASGDSELDRCTPGGDALVDITASGAASGSTAGAGDEYTATCLFFGGGSPDVVLTATLPGRASTLEVSLCGSSFDTVLWVRRDDCAAGAQIGCNDNACALQSSLTLSDVAPGRLYFFVDGVFGAAGAYDLSLDGTLGSREPCDPALAWLSCGAGFVCAESGPGVGDWACRGAACNNGLDDDGDGGFDFPEDPGCVDLEDDSEANAACLNTLDDDDDGAIDYPADPGCANLLDGEETDPLPAPACADGDDDDGDGAIDWPDDPGCHFAGDTNESDPCGDGVPVTDLTLERAAAGSTVGLDDLLAPTTCAAGSTAPDAVFLYRVFTERTVTASLVNPGTSYDTVLFVRRASCLTGDEVACNDNASAETRRSEVTFTATPGDYYIAVSGFESFTGSYDLTITEAP